MKGIAEAVLRRNCMVYGIPTSNKDYEINIVTNVNSTLMCYTTSFNLILSLYFTNEAIGSQNFANLPKVTQ